MTPYRIPDEAAQRELEKQEKRAKLAAFGIRQAPDGEWKPILERVETDPCRTCKGFGTYGNPLCGAVYNCERCKGTGYDPEPATLPKPKQTLWQKITNWWGKDG